HHPKFRDEKIVWLEKRLSDEEVARTPIDISDAQLALARLYNFRDWAALEAYVEAVTVKDSPVFLFESAVEAVVSGNEPALQELLRRHPELVRARSIRETDFDPPRHNATLLHYVAANGVEGYRQKTPKNAVMIAKMLLSAGSEPDALA